MSSLFQVIADRAEKAAKMLTTNLSFSEWTKVIPNTGANIDNGYCYSMGGRGTPCTQATVPYRGKPHTDTEGKL